MTNNNSNDQRSLHDRLPAVGQVRAIVFAVVLVTSIAVAPLLGAPSGGIAAAASPNDATAQPSPSLTTAQTATDDNTSYYDDFEDGDYDGWSDPSGVTSISNESFYGSQSINVQDDGDGARWTSGPSFHTQDSFEFSGTYKVEKSTSDRVSVRFGIIERDTTSDDPVTAQVQHHFGRQEYNEGDIGLVTSEPGNSSRSESEVITKNSLAQGTWADFRLQFSDGNMKYKMWAAGTEEPNDWQITHDAPDINGEFRILPGVDEHGEQIYFDQIDAGGNAISGQVVDQNGDPVPNATVGGIGVNYDAVNESIDNVNATAEEIEEEASRLMDEAQNVEVPDEWQNFSDEFTTDNGFFNADKFTDGIDGTYPLVHQEGDWGEGSTGFLQEEVDNPRINLDSEEQVVISLWDLSQGNLIVPQGPVAGSHPGGVTEGTVVLEQYGPGEGIVDREKIDTQHEYTVERLGPVPNGEFHAIKRSLSPGIYRVYPEGSPAKAYTFNVGDAEDQWAALETRLQQDAEDLEGESSQLTERAQQLQSNIDSGLFERRTTTTDENGTFSLRMQTGVQKATVQAYRADGTILPDITGPSFSDLRDAADGSYNGTFHVGPPTRHDVPKENVTIETLRTDQLPFQGIDSLNEFENWVRDQRLNETIEDIQSEYDERFAEMNRTALERIYQSHRPIVKTVPGAQDRYLNRSEFDEIQAAEDLTDDELATETDHMQVALSGVGEIELPDVSEEDVLEIIENRDDLQITPDPGNVTDADDFIEVEYPLPAGVNPDTIAPELHWSNGSVMSIDDQYWEVQSNGAFSGDTLVISGIPIDDTDPAAFDIRVQAASTDDSIVGGGEDGILDDRLSALNPSFSGTIPDVRAIDVSTLSPGNSERVSMTFRTGDDSDFESVESVEVFGPDDDQLDTSISDGDQASFTTNGAGEHFVRATVTDSTGSEFVQSFSIDALDQGRSNPPTVRAETAVGDRVFAVAGEGLSDAEIRPGDTLEVDAIVPGGETPGSIHVKPQAAMDGDETQIDVRVLEGPDGATVSTNVETVIHLDSLPDNARVWRGEPGFFGEALTKDGGTRYGEVMGRGGEDSDKVVIRTYSTGDGSVSITIDERDGWVGTFAGYQHGFAVAVPRPNIPFISGLFGALGSGGALGTVAGLAVHRRRKTV